MKKTLIIIVATVSFGGTMFSQNTLPATGRVGIGTTTPTAQLSVKGSAKIDSTLVADSVVVKKGARVNGNFVVDGETILHNNVTLSTTLNVMGRSRFNSYAVFDDKVYFPAIATATNLESLSFVTTKEGTGDVQKIDLNLVIGELYKPRLCATDVNGNVLNPSWNNGPNKLYTNCAKVGIGTDNPLQKLDVRGRGLFTTGINVGNTTSTIANQAMIEVDAPSEIATTPFIRMSVSAQGSATKTKFLVEKSGMLWCTAVRVRLSENIGVPDYVFKPEYKLMPLSEVKSFFMEYYHLPNIPSEAEIRENGLNMEEMQLKLLEKVEELTLYVIQLEESRKVMEAKIAQLETQKD